MSKAASEVKGCPIPTRVLTLKDWSQLPDCYSQTPGGTLFSTTPGGNTNFSLEEKKTNKAPQKHCFIFSVLFFACFPEFAHETG